MIFALFLLVGILLLATLIETLYCRLVVKLHHKPQGDTQGSDDASALSSSISTGKNSKLKKIGRRALKIIDDFIFVTFKLCGYFPSHTIRIFFYKHVYGMTIEENVVIYYGLEARSPWNIKIGQGSIIGDHCILDGRFGINIGSNVNISTGVWMWTLQHDVNSSTFSSNGCGKPITISERAWISSRTTLLPGVNIEAGVVVAAGALVSKSCPQSYSIYAGVPAKKISDRNQNLTYHFDGSHRLFL